MSSQPYLPVDDSDYPSGPPLLSEKREAGEDEELSDEEILGPGTPSKEAIHRLLHSKRHLRLKHRAYTVCYTSLAGLIVLLIGVGLSSWWGYRVLLSKKYIMFLNMGATVMAIVWTIFSFMYARDVKRLEDPAWLQIDICQMITACATSFIILFYVFHKTEPSDKVVFDLACGVNGCSSGTFAVYEYAPLVVIPQLRILSAGVIPIADWWLAQVAIILLVIAALQIYLSIIIAKDPIVTGPPKKPAAPKRPDNSGLDPGMMYDEPSPDEKAGYTGDLEMGRRRSRHERKATKDGRSRKRSERNGKSTRSRRS